MSKKKRVLIIIGFALSISIIGLSIYKIVETSRNIKEDKTVEEKKRIEKKGTAKEENNKDQEIEIIKKESILIEGTPVTDISLKTNILNKVNALLGTPGIFNVNNNYLSSVTVYNSLLKLLKNNYDNAYKLLLALTSTKHYSLDEYPKVDDKIRNVNREYRQKLQNKTAVTNEEGLIYIDIIDVEELKKNYRNLFNEEISEFIDETPYIFGFANYIYDKENNIYYSGPAGGGTTADNIKYIYINSINTKDDYIYVYINCGYLSSNSIDGITKISVYDLKSYEANDKIINWEDRVKNDSAISTVLEVNDNDFNIDMLMKAKVDKTEYINESNYKGFTNYRIVFKKNEDDNYYFVKVE